MIAILYADEEEADEFGEFPIRSAYSERNFGWMRISRKLNGKIIVVSYALDECLEETVEDFMDEERECKEQ